jgi:flavin reductase (DIM6/NTAB) family NADH-FMN oxidoreductase RutF
MLRGEEERSEKRGGKKYEKTAKKKKKRRSQVNESKGSRKKKKIVSVLPPKLSTATTTNIHSQPILLGLFAIFVLVDAQKMMRIHHHLSFTSLGHLSKFFLNPNTTYFPYLSIAQPLQQYLASQQSISHERRQLRFLSTSSGNNDTNESEEGLKFRHTKTGPRPDWKPGDRIETPLGDSPEMLSLEPKKLGIGEVYRLIISGIVPRPIAFVSTIDKTGKKGNLAPFSYFNGVGSSPASLVIAITVKPDGSKKDTLLNIEETGEFVVNTVSDWMAEPMNHCSAAYPYGVDEMSKAGLTPVASQMVKPPRVLESPVQLECKVFGTMQVGSGLGSSTLVVGEILLIHIAKHVLQQEAKGRTTTVDIEKLKPLSRLGGNSYGRTNDIFDVPRPKV